MTKINDSNSLTLSYKGHQYYGSESADRLLEISHRFRHIWGRGIRDLDDAFLQDGARSGSTLGIEGYRVERFNRFDVLLMTGGRRGSVNQLMSFETDYAYHARIKQPCCAFHDRIEHRLHFSGRAAND